MPEAFLPGREAEMRALRREFADGLPHRVAGLRTALTACAGGFDRGAVEVLYHGAHALKGTAASYGAEELVEPARRLEVIGKGWWERAAVAGAERTAAGAALSELEAAVSGYRSRLERDQA